MMIKLSDYLVKYLGTFTDSIFLVSGGGVMHIVDSIGRSSLKSYCCHHEQAVAKCAEGYARIKQSMGVGVVTTGPGGTNAITGVAACWTDNIPILIISGQVRKPYIVPEEKKGKLRQVGQQELNIIDIVKPITKYAAMVDNPSDIKYHLQRAHYMAMEGKPGPVWLDIPLDVQNAEIDENLLSSFLRPINTNCRYDLSEIVSILNTAKRPLLLVGNGIWLSHAEDILKRWINKVKINMITAMSGDDLGYGYEYYLGTQGLTGVKPANYAIDNCDVLLIIGTRMQIRQTSFNHDKLSPITIMIDIDDAEFDKINFQPMISLKMDAYDFLLNMNEKEINLTRWDVNVSNIHTPVRDDDYVDIYDFFEEFNKHNKLDVITSNGMTAESASQCLRKGRRKLTNTSFGEMGQGLPTAIGACVARNRSPVVCLEGDGSIMMNIQELQTIKYHNLPIIIFIFNNGGYYSIRNTHKRYFGKIFAADESSGLSLPNWKNLVKGWGFRYECISNYNDLHKVETLLNYNVPVICELKINPDQVMSEKWQAGDLRDTGNNL